MLYIIGLGLNEKSLGLEALEAIKKCKKIYLESYTVNFPYKKENLEKTIGKKVVKLERRDVESDMLVKEAKKQDIALLVYGSPLFATTHISLILETKKLKTKVKIIYNASIFDAIAETGLQLYKFGKITNITKHKSDSFFDTIEENKKINAHSLILFDIDLSVGEALEKLQNIVEKKNFKLRKIIVCSRLGTKDAVMEYGKIQDLAKREFKLPACIILLGSLHFLEKEALERLK